MSAGQTRANAKQSAVRAVRRIRLNHIVQYAKDEMLRVDARKTLEAYVVEEDLRQVEMDYTATGSDVRMVVEEQGL